MESIGYYWLLYLICIPIIFKILLYLYDLIQEIDYFLINRKRNHKLKKFDKQFSKDNPEWNKDDSNADQVLKNYLNKYNQENS